jgi:uncharacterized membrane protein
MPTWVLTLAYWIHMGATVAWIGGLFFQSALLYPTLVGQLDVETSARLMRRIHARFSPIAWFSLALLIATGLTQMTAHPNYQGFLEVSNVWSVALLAKHITIGLMVTLAAYQTWVLGPRMERAALQRAAVEDQAVSSRQLSRLLSANFALAVVVLGLTAIARTA